ncbi:MAG: hypothetical protein IMW97_05330 [Firmicutes bacterium]|nr:hypothetical protein [Candidatus Fermentithermobacillaceae bacterium]
MSSFNPKPSKRNLPALVRTVAPYKVPLGLLLLIVTMFVALWYPCWRDLQKLRASILTRQGELRTLSSSLQTKQKTEELRREALEIVQAKESRLRPDLDGSRLAAEWETLCYKTGLTLVSLRIDEPQALGPAYQKAPFKVSVSGSLQGILRFLEATGTEMLGLSTDQFEISFNPGDNEKGIPASYALTIQGSVFAKGSSDGQP